MTESPRVRLRHLKADGAKIHINLTCKATPDSVERFCDEASAWAARLLEAVEPFGSARAARFETLTPIKPEELNCLNGVHCFNSYHFETMREHAARIYRLDELLTELSLEKPRGKGGRPPKDDDSIVDRAQEIIAAQKKRNQHKALIQALDEINPPLDSADYENAYQRIYRRKLKDK